MPNIKYVVEPIAIKSEICLILFKFFNLIFYTFQTAVYNIQNFKFFLNTFNISNFLVVSEQYSWMFKCLNEFNI